MTILTSPHLFMYAITALFAISGIRHLFAGDWPQVAYAVGAVTLNLAVLTMSKP